MYREGRWSFTEKILIVSRSEKSFDFFTEILQPFSTEKFTPVFCGGEARRQLAQKDFDLVIINAPLKDESGEELAKFIASSGICQVILIVKSEYYGEITEAVEDYGVITISKPINKNLLWSSLKFAKAAGGRLKTMRNENDKLLKRIENIRIVDRAKCILISCLGMSESEAHRHLEKQAMDLRKTKREVAEEIIKTYEN